MAIDGEFTARDKQIANYRIDMQKVIVRNDQWQTCLNCDEWDNETETCKLFGNVKPPAHIIVNGCEDHCFLIPF